MPRAPRATAPRVVTAGSQDPGASPALVVSPADERAEGVTAEGLAALHLDNDGDGLPGGSVSQLDLNTARTAWAACREWTALHGDMLRPLEAWDDIPEGARHDLVVMARTLIANEGADTNWLFDLSGRWEDSVRAKLFAVIVRAIAL